MKPEELHNIYGAEEQFWWYQGMRAITAALMDPLFQSRGGVGLDAGCGTGFNAMTFETRHGLRMVGVDLAPLAIQYCRQINFSRSLVSSITALPFHDETFDVITSFDVLSSLPPGGEQPAVREFSRVLRPAGWMMLRVPAFQMLRSRHSEFVAERQRYRASEMLRMLTGMNFQVTRWTYANAFLSPIALLKFRVWETLRREEPRSGVAVMPPPWLNRLLRRVLLCEAALIRRGCRFLFGQSLIVVAQKPTSSHNI
ncbi:MAG: class I SAM-dependent methyltransferase [Acidobacteria bacterium]|nr:class I SAM-dependent methyltransferase [Acidobacteriota bacterium]